MREDRPDSPTRPPIIVALRTAGEDMWQLAENFDRIVPTRLDDAHLLD